MIKKIIILIAFFFNCSFVGTSLWAATSCEEFFNYKTRVGYQITPSNYWLGKIRRQINTSKAKLHKHFVIIEDKQSETNNGKRTITLVGINSARKIGLNQEDQSKSYDFFDRHLITISLSINEVKSLYKFVTNEPRLGVHKEVDLDNLLNNYDLRLSELVRAINKLTTESVRRGDLIGELTSTWDVDLFLVVNVIKNNSDGKKITTVEYFKINFENYGPEFYGSALDNRLSELRSFSISESASNPRSPFGMIKTGWVELMSDNKVLEEQHAIVEAAHKALMQNSITYGETFKNQTEVYAVQTAFFEKSLADDSMTLSDVPSPFPKVIIISNRKHGDAAF